MTVHKDNTHEPVEMTESAKRKLPAALAARARAEGGQAARAAEAGRSRGARI